MNANELAEIADGLSCEIPIREWIDNEPKNVMNDIATMLRQQQAEIEALKKKLENLPMSLKDDIEYWSEKATCNKCNDTGWVCEWHPDKEAHKCCGGAGMPCECTKGER